MVHASATTIELARELPHAVVALGGESKNTLCCANGHRAVISAARAELARLSDYDDFLHTAQVWPAELGMIPSVLAHDLHPEYLSTKAAARGDLWPHARRVAIQHHAAHIAACAAAENMWDSCWGLACDGTGLGSDGTLWGGEIMRGSITDGFLRAARLRPMHLIGGTAAIREPWRIALALAHDAGIAWRRPDGVPDEAWHVTQTLCTGTALPRLYSSSVGRLFDGISALLGVCCYAAHEAQAAMALEQCAADVQGEPHYDLPCAQAADGMMEFDWRPLLRQVWAEYNAGGSRAAIAARFHDSLAAALVEWCAINGGPRTIVCGGGVFFNRRFSRTVQRAAARTGLHCVLPHTIPPSDAGVSLGQAVLAAFM